MQARLIGWIAAALCAGTLAPSSLRAQEEAPPEALHLSFGVYTSDKALTMYRMFMPVLQAFQDGLETELGLSVDLELRIFRTYQEGIDALVEGKVDFVRFGPASYITARERNAKLRLLAIEEKKGERRFKGVVVVRTNSRIQNLGDLKGKTFAFGDKNSTIGRYLIQNEMQKIGLRGPDLAGYQYLGGHDNVFRAVEIGDYDAGSLKISTYKKLNAKGQLRVIHEMDNVCKPWIANSELDEKVVTALRKVLLAIESPEVLTPLNITSFGAVKNDEYDFVRDAMEGADKFLEVKTSSGRNRPITR
ncbi:MAG: PhnD/SsuA/transferrin family substrate-binding protein [Planctomycetes bacterium]|nr:PhnD/SsuA/transferrin family substrate-binding protein [Planctomycetota bacterium]